MVSDNLEQPVDPSVDTESHPVQSSTPEISAKPSLGKSWYVVKVQSGREESIKEALEKESKLMAWRNSLAKYIFRLKK